MLLNYLKRKYNDKKYIHFILVSFLNRCYTRRHPKKNVICYLLFIARGMLHFINFEFFLFFFKFSLLLHIGNDTIIPSPNCVCYIYYVKQTNVFLELEK